MALVNALHWHLLLCTILMATAAVITDKSATSNLRMHRFVHSGNELDRAQFTVAYYTFGRRGQGDKFLGHDKYFNYNLDEKQYFTFSFVHSPERNSPKKRINFIRVAVLQDSQNGTANVTKFGDEMVVVVRAWDTHFCAASCQFYGQ